jgi:hypothetical protein
MQSPKKKTLPLSRSQNHMMTSAVGMPSVDVTGRCPGDESGPGSLEANQILVSVEPCNLIHDEDKCSKSQSVGDVLSMSTGEDDEVEVGNENLADPHFSLGQSECSSIGNFCCTKATLPSTVCSPVTASWEG